MAAEAVASTSNSQTHSSPAVVTSMAAASWSPASYSLEFLHWYGLQNYYNMMAASLVPAANLQDRTLRKRKANSPNEVVSQQHGAAVLSGDSTRLFDRRGKVTFKPYNDIRLDSSLSTLPGEHYHQIKRRHLDGLRGTNGLHGLKQGSSLSKKTQVIQPDRGCTIGNLFPEVLSIIFEYLDEQSKGRVAQVRSKEIFGKIMYLACIRCDYFVYTVVTTCLQMHFQTLHDFLLVF